MASTPVNWESRENHYADRIRTAWSKTIAGIIDTGNALIEAKAELQFGHFEHLVKEQCPFGARSAQRLMAISSHKVISNATHGSVLPASWRTLYELTKFEPRELNHALGNHWLKPDIQRQDVPDLHRRVRKALGNRTRQPAPPPARPPSFAQWLRQCMDAELISWFSSLEEDTAQAVAERVAREISIIRKEMTDGKQPKSRHQDERSSRRTS